VDPLVREIDRQAAGGQLDQPFRFLETASGRPEKEPDDGAPRDGLDHVRVQEAFVEPLSSPQVGHALDAVVVVPDQHDERRVMLPSAVGFERDVERPPALPESGRRHAKERDEPIARLLRRIVHEACVYAERHVVEEELVGDGTDVDLPLRTREGTESADGIARVDVEVSRKVIPRSERDADERKIALERDGCDRSQRAVPARHPERAAPGIGSFARQLARVLALLEDVRVDPEAFRLAEELGRRGAAVSRAGIDEQEAFRQRLRWREASTPARLGRDGRPDRSGRTPRCRSACG
jgi:hypothetical protein